MSNELIRERACNNENLVAALGMIERTEFDVSIVALEADYVAFYDGVRNVGTPGKAFYDGEADGSKRSRIIVSDGKHIFSYPIGKEQPRKEDGRRLFIRGAHVKCYDIDKAGQPLHNDGRNRVRVSYNTDTVDGTALIYNYQLQIILWSLKDRLKLKQYIAKGMLNDVVVNHKNNDCRDNDFNNLEVTLTYLNKLHEVIVNHIIWMGSEEENPFARYRGEAYYLPTDLRQKKQKHSINFRLSCDDILGYTPESFLNPEVLEHIYKKSGGKL